MCDADRERRNASGQSFHNLQIFFSFGHIESSANCCWRCKSCETFGKHALLNKNIETTKDSKMGDSKAFFKQISLKLLKASN